MVGPRRGKGRLEAWAAIVLLSAGCAQSPIAVTPPASTAEASATTITLPTDDVLPVQSTPTARACFTQEELAAMPLREVAALAQVCYRSSDGVETQIDQAKALEAIHGFLEEEGRLVGFREITQMANSPGMLRVARFEDEQGRSYLVAVVANRVLEMDPGITTPPIQGPILATDELQALAEAIILRELPQFTELRSQLIASQGVKSGESYFFRYEYADGGPWFGLPPLAQVGLTADGQMFSYLNTLYFLP
jgi:hypothetical protein